MKAKLRIKYETKMTDMICASARNTTECDVS